MKQVRIIGTGRTKLGRLGVSATVLAQEALDLALKDAGIKDAKTELNGLVAVPSLSNPHFMQAHYLATKMKLLPNKKGFVVRTLDTGGAGPISALTTAVTLIRNEWCETVAVLASDAVLSLPSKDFLKRADESVQGTDLPSPCIPNGYDRIAQWQMEKFGVTREQLAMVPVLMSMQAMKHPDALCRKPYTLEEVLQSKLVGKVTNLLECARRADGAAAIILSSANHYKRCLKEDPSRKPLEMCPVVVSTGEASGPLYPPPLGEITGDLFSCERAAKHAYHSAQLGVQDIDFFGLYDCFPICFIRALEAVGVCEPGRGGEYVESIYRGAMQKAARSGSADNVDLDWPINTHGGLQCFGAPWEAPAMFNVLEAVEQLQGAAGARQIRPKPQRALVYGNGGIFSASAVAILGDGVYS
jgi:acetyl-CoA acetyltransferase